jgi:hypothetical protein
VNVLAEPTANVALLPLVMDGGTCTVTDAVEVTEAGTVAELVTVRVYVVVDVGETLTGVPLVTAPTPWSTLPVPPLNIAVRVVELPVTIVATPDVKLVIAGAGTTVTRAVLVTAVPAAFVTVSV